jgi:4-amino-4-deoxy-L-arabinose transferase-like glycosyltransferase
MPVLVLHLSSRSHSGRSKSGRRGTSETAPKVKGVSHVATFLADLKELLPRYAKHTSAGHKQLVLLLVLAGAFLRGWFLMAPISADEAFMWVHYGSHSASMVISDLAYPQNQILHTLLVKLSAGIFGVSKVTIRLPAFIAAVLSMPLFYLFVRAMFNRYIAVMALALVASSGALIEYSALANGQAVVWLFILLALAFGRHFHKGNNVVSAVFMGLMLALAMWTSTTAIFPSMMVLLWSLFHLLFNHSDSLPARMINWSVAFLVFLLLTLLLYAPVIKDFGILQLLHHNTLPDHTWKKFKRIHHEGAMMLWFHLLDTSGRIFATLGLVGLVAAAYISVKYRTLTFAMLLGAVVPVLLNRYVPEPQAWLYTLYILHISTALVLFYILKYVQEKAMPSLGKRTRVAVASVVLLVACGWPSMYFLMDTDRIARFPEAEPVAHFFRDAMEPQDRIIADHPWEDPLVFHLMCEGLGIGAARGTGVSGSHLYVVVDPGIDQTIEAVLAQQGLDQESTETLELVKEVARLKVYEALMR